MKEFKIEMNNGNIVLTYARTEVEAMRKAEELNRGCGFYTKAISAEEV